MAMTLPNESRAVLRPLEAGNPQRCPQCNLDVKFNARTPSAKRKKVICNVYEDGKWVRVEHYHPACYEEAGQPYGEAQ